MVADNSNSGSYSKDAIERRRQIGQALLQESLKPQQIQSWTQGLAEMARAGMGGYIANKADQQDKSRQQAIASLLLGNGPSTPSANNAGPQASGQQGEPSSQFLLGDMRNYADAISKNESGGNYGELGPVTSKGDRAYGKYQVMGNNIPEWTQSALGKQLTPEQFLSDKEAQDKVFSNQFGGYVNKTGNPQDAASMWLTGRPLAQGANASDQLGTTGQSYVNKFNANLGQPQAAQVASLDPSAGVTPQSSPAQNVAGALSQPPQQQVAQNSPAPQAQGGLLGNVAPQNRDAIAKLLATDPSMADTLAPALVAQSVSKPTWGKIGADIYGQETYGWIDPNSKSITTSDGKPFNPTTNNSEQPPAESATGEPFLQSLHNPARAAQIKALDSGELPFPSGFALKSPYWQHLLSDLYKYNPNASAQAASGVKAFNTGKQGDVTRFINAASSHLNLFDQLIPALKNGDVKAINSLSNAWKTQFGQTAPTNFNAAKQIIADEVLKAVIGAGAGTGADRENLQKQFDASNSPDQLEQAVGVAKGLMRGQSQALEQQYKASTGRDDYKNKYITPEAQKALYPPEEVKNPSGQSAPKAGDIEGGYQFKGGDPSKQENWIPAT